MFGDGVVFSGVGGVGCWNVAFLGVGGNIVFGGDIVVGAAGWFGVGSLSIASNVYNHF